MATATECNVCAAVAAGGRIRIASKEQADLLLAILRSARRTSLRARRAAIDHNKTVEMLQANNAIRLMDMASEELQRLIVERGWRHGQLQHSVP